MTDYANKFQGNAAAQRYKRKFDNRIDRLRHDVEVAILAKHAAGRVFDCTIGVGRFIGALPAVTSYTGMDLSPDFVAYVNETFPGTGAVTGDLTARIEQPSDAFDTVILLRSLSAIGHVPHVLGELVRITRPGGTIIFDYGRRATQTVVNGKTITIDDAPLDDIVGALPVQLVARIWVDAVTTTAKRHRHLYRLLTGRAGALLPDRALMALERAATPKLGERQIVIVRKNLG